MPYSFYTHAVLIISFSPGSLCLSIQLIFVKHLLHAKYPVVVPALDTIAQYFFPLELTVEYTYSTSA